MKDTLKSIPSAVGLASNQVGIKGSIITYYKDSETRTKDENDIITVLNARLEIVDPSFQISHEGCLCIPETFLPIRRYRTVKLFGLDESGEQIQEDVSGETANIVQHEVDHVNGLLIIDHLSKLKRKIYKKRLGGIR